MVADCIDLIWGAREDHIERSLIPSQIYSLTPPIIPASQLTERSLIIKKNKTPQKKTIDFTRAVYKSNNINYKLNNINRELKNSNNLHLSNVSQ